MDFEKVLPLIIRDFEKEHVRYAAIGGFAIGALGIMRSTMDLDFLVDAQDLDKIERVLKRYDYSCVFKTENVSQYVADLKIFGEIDFLHAFRDLSVSMLKRAQEIAVFDNTFTIKVLCPEDIIGLKLQALVNDCTREKRESADIEIIMDFFRASLHWDLIKEYFELFEKKEEYYRLEKQYNHAE